jgi:predicted acyl esterase
MDTSKGKLYTELNDDASFYKVSIEHNVPMITRDGIILKSDVYRPAPKTLGESFPVLLSKCALQ